ncbi:serine/arginine repetitive matrix protein 1-like [Penaeus chinensis]|uniref:serine/arginine repetitive matrix protein 1-like n=1 Tax=Penaeus chinensis TaxID=139456 RepID=UPI001FB81499|nr:serine/arginine repetitive matrix protein 1-like [Penaeus chinensis]
MNGQSSTTDVGDLPDRTPASRPSQMRTPSPPKPERNTTNEPKSQTPTRGAAADPFPAAIRRRLASAPPKCIARGLRRPAAPHRRRKPRNWSPVRLLACISASAPPVSFAEAYLFGLRRSGTHGERKYRTINLSIINEKKRPPPLSTPYPPIPAPTPTPAPAPDPGPTPVQRHKNWPLFRFTTPAPRAATAKAAAGGPASGRASSP